MYHTMVRWGIILFVVQIAAIFGVVYGASRSSLFIIKRICRLRHAYPNIRSSCLRPPATKSPISPSTPLAFPRCRRRRFLRLCELVLRRP